MVASPWLPQPAPSRLASKIIAHRAELVQAQQPDAIIAPPPPVVEQPPAPSPAPPPRPVDPVASIRSSGALSNELHVRLEVQHEVLLDRLLEIADALREVGGERSSLAPHHQTNYAQCQVALETFGLDAAETAHSMGESPTFALHDPLTLLKSRAFIGLLLRTLGDSPSAKHHHLVVASARLTHLHHVRDKWSAAYADVAALLACRAIARSLGVWNRKHVCVPGIPTRELSRSALMNAHRPHV